MILTWNKADLAKFDPYDKERNVLDIVGYFLSKAQAMLVYEGLPETIPERNLKLLLQTKGYCCIPNPKLLNGKAYALWGALGGEPSPYYMPTKCIVANPALGFNKNLAIGSDCIIIPHDSLYMGLLPLFNKYARLLYENELSMYRATINIRSMSTISAGDDATEKSARQYLSDLEDGKLGVIASNEFLDGIKTSPNSQTNLSINQLIELEQYLKAALYNEIGIDANFNMKRETLNSAETELNQDALLPYVDDIVKTQQDAFDVANKLYGLNIEVKLSSSWKKRRDLLDMGSSQLESEVQ